MDIEIVTTPNGALKESGFGSMMACESVLDAIQQTRHNVRLTVCKTKACLDEVAKRKPDLVMLAVKYIPLEDGDDIWLSDYFSQHKINFTGSSREVLKFDSNKVLAKLHLTNKGIKTAPYFIATPGQYKTEGELPIAFPLFVKPLDAANGNGIDDLSFVTSFAEFESKVASLYASFNQPILVEEYLSGSEFTVAIIKTTSEKLIVSAVEVIPPTSTNGLRILGAQAKIDDSETLIKIADENLNACVVALATNAFNELGIRDFGRIDIKTNEQGECFFMEANLVPGMTYGSSYFPKACDLAHEYSYNEVIELLLAGGLVRASPTIPPNIYPDSDGNIAATF
jgi:D-alanine-D-alanine ligase